MTSRRHFWASGRLRKLLTHGIGSVAQKSHARRIPRPLPHTSQRNLTLLRRTPNPKVHRILGRGTPPARPRAREARRTEEVHSRPYLQARERQEIDASGTSTSHGQESLSLLWRPGACREGMSKEHVSSLQGSRCQDHPRICFVVQAFRLRP